MIAIKTYRHESNALYVREFLLTQGIFSLIDEDNEGDFVKFKILINEEDVDKTERIISRLLIDDEALDNTSDGYLQDYHEWSEESSISNNEVKFPKSKAAYLGWKKFTPLLLSSGILSIYFVVKNGVTWTNIDMLIMGVLFLFVGLISIFFSRKQVTNKNYKRRYRRE